LRAPTVPESPRLASRSRWKPRHESPANRATSPTTSTRRSGRPQPVRVDFSRRPRERLQKVMSTEGHERATEQTRRAFGVAFRSRAWSVRRRTDRRWRLSHVRIPVGSAGGSVMTRGGGTGSAGKLAGSSTKRQSTTPSGRAALGAMSPGQPSLQSVSPAV
jgi:hypothetical protein